MCIRDSVWDVKTIQRFSELPDYYFTPDKLEAYKNGNMLKGGLVYADAITTVSNTYAEEIKTPFYGCLLYTSHFTAERKSMYGKMCPLNQDASRMWIRSGQ